MFTILLPCIPCRTKHAKPDNVRNDNKQDDKRQNHAADILKVDDIQGLAGIRTRMQEMGHFLNDASNDPGISTRPAIQPELKTLGVTAELIRVKKRGEKSGTSICMEWDQLRKDIGCKPVS
jgi:hypothetical protein